MESTHSQSLSDSESIVPRASVGTPAQRTRTPWEICIDYAKRNTKRETDAWKDEMANLLLFATLFSSVAGTFAVESYHNVKQDPADTTVLLLKSILALQLNATHPQPLMNFPIDLNPQTTITASARRINVYNFLSLILSLSVVMAGILCLQWLRECDQDLGGISKPRPDHLGIRYMKYKGMEKWHVFAVLRSLPLILLLSLLLFFAGIIELLLGVDRTAAIAASVLIGITAIFMVITTVLPTVLTFSIRWVGHHRFPQCPWKSPQALVFYHIVGPLFHLIASAISILRGRPPSNDTKDYFRLRNWSVYDWLVYKDSEVANVGFGIHWLGTMYLQEKELAAALYECIQDRSTHGSLRKILTVRDTRRAAAIDRASEWTPSGSNLNVVKVEGGRRALVAEVIEFQTLAHLVEKIERGYPSDILLEQRLDLFFKINEKYRDKDIDCPLIGGMNQRVFHSLDMRQKLLHCIYNLIRDNDTVINETHLRAVNDIFEFEANAQSPNIELFDKVLTELGGWIDRNSGKQEIFGGQVLPPPRDNASLLTMVRQVKNHVRLLRGLVVYRE